MVREPGESDEAFRRRHVTLEARPQAAAATARKSLVWHFELRHLAAT